jgi:hypothetical protein
MTTRAQEMGKEAAIVNCALKRYERNYILSGRFDKAQEMAAMGKGIANMVAGVTTMVEHAEVRAA